MSETAAHIAAITRIVKPVNSGAPGLASDSAELSHGTTTQAPRNRTGKIVGGVIGGVVGLLLLLGLLYWLLRRQRRSRATKDGHKEIINDPEAASTAAPTPQQKNSVDQPPQIAQVQSAVVQRPAPAVTAPIAALLPAPMSLTIPQSPTMPSSTLSPDTALSAPHPNDAWRPTSPVSSRGHARSPSINSVISDYVDADEYAATPISASEYRPECSIVPRFGSPPCLPVNLICSLPGI